MRASPEWPADVGLKQVWRGLPAAAYQKPVLKLHTLFGEVVVVCDPAGAKRVLVDNVANYPKTDLEKRFFTALFGHGLLGTDGDLWRRHRRVMAPAFTPAATAGYGAAMASTVQTFRAEWDGLADGAGLDISEEMTRLALRIICRTMFSDEAEEIADVYASSMARVLNIGGPGLLDLLPMVSDWSFARRERLATLAFAPLDRAFETMIDQRRADPAKAPHDDLLARLLSARDDQGAGLSAAEVRDELVTIFMAGHETTAAALTWTFHLLARHPEAERRLHAELDHVLGARPPAQEDISELVYTRQVINEAMRLYPPAPGLSTRRAVADDDVSGVRIRKGTTVHLGPWILHRHKALWDQPEHFDPDRFAPGAGDDRHRFAFMPFGGGPRVCIGQVMAVNEAILILATLAQSYRLSPEPGFRVELLHQVTLRPKKGVKMRLHRRQVTPPESGRPIPPPAG